ncbi:MAG: hypothetical protein ACOYJD_04720 [Christensenellales bacterium]
MRRKRSALLIGMAVIAALIIYLLIIELGKGNSPGASEMFVFTGKLI